MSTEVAVPKLGGRCFPAGELHFLRPTQVPPGPLFERLQPGRFDDILMFPLDFT